MLSNKQNTLVKRELLDAINFTGDIISEEMVSKTNIKEAISQYNEGCISSKELANYILNLHEDVRADVAHRLLIRIYKERPSLADEAFCRILK